MVLIDQIEVFAKKLRILFKNGESIAGEHFFFFGGGGDGGGFGTFHTKISVKLKLRHYFK